MATVVLGSVVADIRGSIGEQTYGRNQGGIFVRARTSPTQTVSSERDTRNAAITDISQAWSATLSEDQRATWRSYANQHPLPDRFGRPRFVSGICHFTRCNAQHYRETLTLTFLVAPTQPPGPPPLFTFLALQTNRYHRIDISGFPYPDAPTGTYLFWYAGHEGPPGRTYYAGPWRYMWWNWREPDKWHYEPWWRQNPWTLTAGNRVWTRMVAVLPDGATSIRYQADAIVT